MIRNLLFNIWWLIKRYAPILAYLLLTAFVVYAFALERDHSNQNRERVAQATHTTLIQGCVRGNDLRTGIRQILQASQVLTANSFHKHQISATQYAISQRFFNDASAKFAPVNCAKAYPKVK